MKNVKTGHSVPVVVLDAGHYGDRNPGVVSGYYEARAMWTLTNYLGTALEAYGIKVIKTRQVQALDLDLVTRGRKAQGADLFISMHSNACDTERVDRPEAIYLWDDDCGKIDEQSKEIAGLLAETVRTIMGTNDKAKIYSRKSGNDRDRDGKINDDYYGVLYGAHQVGTAAIILEHSFHTNVKATKWLLIDANLKKLAEDEAKTIAAWFDVKKISTTTPSKPAATGKKSITEIAQEVIAGKWGNGSDRKAKLTAAGYDADAVQAKVNELISGSGKKSIDEIAREVIAGKWGNGEERKKRLTAAGHDAAAVQTAVNKLVSKK